MEVEYRCLEEVFAGLRNAFQLTASEGSSMSRGTRYTVQDLVQEAPLEQVQTALNELVLKWKQLDATLLNPRKRKGRNSGASFLRLPDGLDLLKPREDIVAHGVANGLPEEYMNELTQIFDSMPRMRQLEERFANITLHSMRFKQHVDALSFSEVRTVLGEYLAQPNHKHSATGSTQRLPLANNLSGEGALVMRLALCASGGSYSSNAARVVQEVEVLGTQTLEQLLPMFYCSRDHTPLHAPAAVPHSQTNSEVNDGRSEPWFLIQGNIFAAPSALHGATLDRVRKWLEEPVPVSMTEHKHRSRVKPRKVLFGAKDDGPCHIHPMNAVRFDQLSMKVGVRCLYVHRGNCEHYVYLCDVRTAHTLLDGDAAQYPRVVFQAREDRRKCSVCDLCTAAYVCIDDKLADRNPLYTCEHCYHMLHYDANGSLLYNDFQVLPYIHADLEAFE